MSKRLVAISAVFLAVLFASSVTASDNGVGGGARKVEGGIRAIGQSAGEIGTKAAKAAEGAAKDTGIALGRAWDDIVRGVKKAFK